MKILHTEASKGWGGQEIRILKEAEGMRKRGYEVLFVTSPGAQLAIRAREKGFYVQEMPLTSQHSPLTLLRLIRFIIKEKIDLINTHSSLDAWLGGIAARLTGRSVIRTRHLSTPIRPGLNSRILYNALADTIVTTCESIACVIRDQAHLPLERCFSVPTGIESDIITVDSLSVKNFRRQWNLSDEDCVVGSVCVLRSWKGISDLLQAAKLLQKEPKLKWLIVGTGPAEVHFRSQAQTLGLQDSVIFTGHIENPFVAIAAIDIFALLSTAHEGVSQASLQAAYLKRPLITTLTGGLPEVCLQGKTGCQISVFSPQEVADSVLQLRNNPSLCKKFGENGHHLVLENFTFAKTLDTMEKVYRGMKRQMAKCEGQKTI